VSEAERGVLIQNGLAFSELLEHRAVGFAIVDACCHRHQLLGIDQGSR
jgi:hypothetical protein